MNEVVNPLAKYYKNSAVLTFIIFDNNQYKFIRYARKTIIQLASDKKIKALIALKLAVTEN